MKSPTQQTSKELLRTIAELKDLAISMRTIGMSFQSLVVDRAIALLERPTVEPKAEPVAWVPIHPKEGPLWTMTMREENHDVLPHYELMPLYSVSPPSLAAHDVLAERERQKAVEGWTSEHDDEHDKEEIAAAAACYALSHAGWMGFSHSWPWAMEWWKPKDRRSDLVRAGALILAEIERLDRASVTKGIAP